MTKKRLALLLVLLLSISIFTIYHISYSDTIQSNNVWYEQAIIPSSESLSNAIDLGDYEFIQIEMPSSWTTANLTFKVSRTFSGTYKDLYDDSGTEVSVTASGNRVIAIDSKYLELAGARFVKIRSGTTGTPVNQSAERLLYLLLKK